MTVTIDDRERDVIALCPSATVQRLTLADVLIHDSNGDVVLALERKTVADLEASVKDGRLQEQRARLIEAYGQRFAFVIEGAVDWTDSRMAGVMTGLILRHRLPVFHTADKRATAALIAHLDGGADKGKLAPYGADGPSKPAEAPKKKVAGRAAAESMLACVTGVSTAAARAVLDEHGDIRTLSQALADHGAAAVSKLTVNGRKLGKVGDKLLSAMVRDSATVAYPIVSEPHMIPA